MVTGARRERVLSSARLNLSTIVSGAELLVWVSVAGGITGGIGWICREGWLTSDVIGGGGWRIGGGAEALLVSSSVFLGGMVAKKSLGF